MEHLTRLWAGLARHLGVASAARPRWRRRLPAVAALLAAALFAGLRLGTAPARATDFIVLASTTSTEQSGLFAHLLPAFTNATGIEVRVVAVGTGQALDLARRGDADVVLVHDPAAEARFLAEGFSTRRREVMANDFVLVGPKSDPAGARGRDIAAALKRVAASGRPFVSRGDSSGTHAAELRLWRTAGVDLAAARPAGYRECGCGMGPALNIAAATGAYVLSDRGTWLGFANRGDLAIVVEGDRTLANRYGVMVVDPAKHPHVKAALAQRFADWLVSPAGQQTIAAYRIGGEPVFFATAGH